MFPNKVYMSKLMFGEMRRTYNGIERIKIERHPTYGFSVYQEIDVIDDLGNNSIAIRYLGHYYPSSNTFEYSSELERYFNPKLYSL